MEFFTVLLLLLIIFLIVRFRNSITEQIKKIESDIQDLQKTFSSSTPATPEPEVKESKQVPPGKEEKDYWKSSFQVVDTPADLPGSTIRIEEEKVDETEEMDAKEEIPVEDNSFSLPAKTKEPPPVLISQPTFFERNPDLEKFIGENLISKIGIAILVLAIGFFVKFAIDNNWIGAVGRVSIGILCGGILVALAHRLRNSYKAFSSVLAGGGLAVFYFTITLAYHQFNLFSQPTAFIIMVMITAFAIVLSILYNRQELAIIALVGGFAAPFLVSDGSGNYKVLFTFLLILNTGLLVIAYNKAWRVLNIIAFVFTVVLFTGWLVSLNNASPAFTYSNGLLFATCFYLLFFGINISNNIKENKKFIASDFSILLLNTGLYFSAGLWCITMMNKPEFRGLFTIIIALFNLLASFFLFRNRKVDANILYLLTGITLTFVSLTAPIQLHGHNITIFWASESVLLLWLFLKSRIRIIQYASLIVWIAMLVSLTMDWMIVYSDDNLLPVLINKAFITGFYCAIASYALFVIRGKMITDKGVVELRALVKVFRITGIILLFITGALEINFQFNHFFPGTNLNILYLQLYYFLFILILLWLNKCIAKVKIPIYSQMLLLASCIAVYLLSIGIITGLQRELLQAKRFYEYFDSCWICAVCMLIIFYRVIKTGRLIKIFSSAQYAPLVWLFSGIIVLYLSFETLWIVTAMFYSNTSGFESLDNVFIKACLPILWGVSSFGFMWIGMKYTFKPLRIISLVLFLITLLKLFIFDISNIPVAGKIAAFFCLGVLLLIVSFMYQRLKKIIIQDEQDKPV